VQEFVANIPKQRKSERKLQCWIIWLAYWPCIHYFLCRLVILLVD